MSEILTTTFLSALISGAVLAGLPLLFAGLGETLGERAGILGIGQEGYMLIGAYAGFNGALYGHSPWVGLLCGVIAGMVISLIVVFLSVRFGLDQIVVGIGIILLAEGLTSVLARGAVRSKLSAIGRDERAPHSGAQQDTGVGREHFQPTLDLLDRDRAHLRRALVLAFDPLGSEPARRR